ncbi:hypothetical protein ScPMuIL_011334 [Solemya velum]
MEVIALVMLCIPMTLSLLFTSTLAQTNYEVTFSFFEEGTIGSVFGNIANETRLALSYSPEDFATFRYEFLGTNENQHLFTVDSTTGDLATAKRINRELQCSEIRTQNCVLEFNVGIRSSRPDFFIFTAVKIIVKDKNDNSPKFSRNEILLNISESSVVGSEFPVDAADDLDIGINGIQSYELTPSSEMFSLRVLTKLDGRFELKIIVKAPLNRETEDSYQVQIIAKDGGNPQNIGILRVNITVIDTNDNAPEFKKGAYNITVREDAKIGERIIHIIATDQDSGSNGELAYSFSDHTTGFDEVKQLFRINRTTGEVYVAGKLEYKPGKKYIIFIEATDQAKPFHVSQTVLNIDVVDSGNNPPVINILSQGNVNIPESSKNGTFIAYVDVEDSDTGPNSEVTCRVPSPMFDIQNQGSGYRIVLKSQLDRETEPSHNITVICQDSGSPSLSASASLLVKVSDVNDNKPKFTQNIYSTTLRENNEKGITVVHVSAHDRDDPSTPNSRIRYVLESDASQNFSVNPETGLVSSKSTFDREIAPELTFHVFAVDQGKESKTGTTTVIVKITDENDNSPVFPTNEISLNILENGTMDTFVGKINATDNDEGENGEITYFMSQDFESFIPFIVYPDGVVRSKGKLNREQQSRYDFMVFAKDQGNPPRNSSVFVTVNVMDINDMSPVIEFPNNWNNTVYIFYNSPHNTLITTMKAYDLDSGLNRVLKYSIEDGNEEQIFSVDSETGEVFLVKNHKIESDKVFPLMICVKDSGRPSKMTRTQLNIVLTASLPNEASNKYVIISVIVVVVTLIISAALITGIYFLRKGDKPEQQKPKQDHNYKKETLVKTDSEISNPIKNTNEQAQFDINRKNKKEVSFSLSDNFTGLNNSSSLMNENNTFMYPKLENATNVNPQDSEEQLKRECQLKSLQLQQIMMNPETRGWGAPSKHQARDAHRSHHHEDCQSESSGEATTCDSGRGGSEDEITTPSCSHNDSRMSAYPCQSPYQYPSTFIISNKSPTCIQHSQLENGVPVLSTFSSVNNKQRHYSEQNVNKNKQVSQPLLHIPKQTISSPSFHSMDNFMHCYPVSSTKIDLYNPIGPQNMCYSRQESLSTLRSREDDDDAATTTSGSYTINPEELNDDLYQLQRDMFV